MVPIEIWKDINDYIGFYQISNYGRIKSLARFNNNLHLKEKILKIRKVPSSNHYHNIVLCKNGIQTQRTIHRLVAEAFIPNPLNKPQINHKDGNKVNNSSDNLEWCTNKENYYHALRTGLHPYNLGNNKDCKPLLQLSLDNKIIQEFFSRQEAIRRTGINRGGIWKSIKTGQSAGGFKWQYKSGGF